MSVFAGRVFLGVCTVVLIGATAWFAIGWQEQPWFAGSEVAVVLALLAVIGLLVGAPLMGRFCEAEVSGNELRITRVLGSTRVIRLTDIHDAVVGSVALPSRLGSVMSERIAVRADGRVLAAFTPRTHGLPELLEQRGIRVSWPVDEAGRPANLRRVIPGSVSFSEHVATLLPYFALAAGAIALIVVLILS